MSDTVVMSAEGLSALQAEIKRLEGEGRREIAARISIAREWGDLKENSEYKDCKESQARLETQILRLRAQELAAEIREPLVGGEVAGFGSQVNVRDVARNREVSYTLVSGPDAKPAENLISLDSPAGRALLGVRAGDTVTVRIPSGERTLAVLSVA